MVSLLTFLESLLLQRKTKSSVGICLSMSCALFQVDNRRRKGLAMDSLKGKVVPLGGSVGYVAAFGSGCDLGLLRWSPMSGSLFIRVYAAPSVLPPAGSFSLSLK